MKLLLKMQSSTIVAAFALTVLFLATYPSSSEGWIIDGGLRQHCKQPCTDPVDCNMFVKCKYEEEIDNCGRKFCTRGPDEKCGGNKGKCAKGLACTECGLCGGCASKTMVCAQNAFDCKIQPVFY